MVVIRRSENITNPCFVSENYCSESHMSGGMYIYSIDIYSRRETSPNFFLAIHKKK